MSRAPDLFGKKKNPVSLIEKLISSEAFTSLYHEGMGLVEEAAAYLDGEGRGKQGYSRARPLSPIRQRVCGLQQD